MSPLAALHALGLDLHDVADMKRHLLDALRNATRDLLESFGEHP